MIIWKGTSRDISKMWLHIKEVYLEPSRTSTMRLLKQLTKIVNNFYSLTILAKVPW